MIVLLLTARRALASALAPGLLQEDGLKVAERLVCDRVGQRERSPRVDLGGGHVDDATRLRQGLAASAGVDLIKVVHGGVRNRKPSKLRSGRYARGAGWRVELDHGQPSGRAARLQCVVDLSLCLQISHRALAPLCCGEIFSSLRRYGRHAQRRRFQDLRHFLHRKRKLFQALCEACLLIPKGLVQPHGRRPIAGTSLTTTDARHPRAEADARRHREEQHATRSTGGFSGVRISSPPLT